MENNRLKDSMVEREVAKFLDSNLYSDKSLFKYFRRTDERYEQVKGSDVVVSTTNGKLYNKVVDEKVATRYANTDLSTFSLELSFINRAGKRSIGWFLDSSKITEYYLLGWILKADIPYDNVLRRWKTYDITSDNIESLEWALVSRQEIVKFLERNGWTLDRIHRQDEKIRDAGCVETHQFVDGISFRYSPTYIERPVNILIKKESYLEISELSGIVNKK